MMEPCSKVITYTCGVRALVVAATRERLEAVVKKYESEACPLCQLEDGTLTPEAVDMLEEAIERDFQRWLTNVARSN